MGLHDSEKRRIYYTKITVCVCAIHLNDGEKILHFSQNKGGKDAEIFLDGVSGKRGSNREYKQDLDLP